MWGATPTGGALAGADGASSCSEGGGRIVPGTKDGGLGGMEGGVDGAEEVGVTTGVGSLLSSSSEAAGAISTKSNVIISIIYFSYLCQIWSHLF